MDRIIHNRAQCQIVWFRWDVDVDDPDNRFTERSETDLAKATAYDISNHLTETFVFNKNLGATSGTFTFRLDNSRDWKTLIKPGDWLLVYMSNQGDLSLPQDENVNSELPPKADLASLKSGNLRGICYVDRVAPSFSVGATGGEFEIVFEIAGRDYGVIYEEMELWFNSFNQEQLNAIGYGADTLPGTGTKSIDELLSIVHDLFLAPQKVIKSKTKESVKLTRTNQQWLMPKTLLDVLGVKYEGPAYFGNIVDLDLKNFQSTTAPVLSTEPLSFLKGKLWDRLKEISVPDLHELYLELSNDGKPKINFRVIPFGVNPIGYPKVMDASDGQVLYLNRYLSEDHISAQGYELLDGDVGQDNHGRYTHFLAQAQSSIYTPIANMEMLKDRVGKSGAEYPFALINSLRRHGFRPMHRELRTLPAAENIFKNGSVDLNLLLEYNELLLDYWVNTINYESGMVKIVGRPDIRIGKTISFTPPTPYIDGKVFYIEDYIDEFVIDENGSTVWTQTLQLTHGAEIEALRQQKIPSLRAFTNYDKNGSFTPT